MSEDKKIKILFVDDDEIIRSTYVDVFKKDNFEVIEAVDGVEGLDKATKEIPDIVFTGIIMPRMDGFGLMEALRKNVTTSQIPVVISSHMGREEDQQKAIQLGAKDFVTRDMTTPVEVVSRVKNALNLNEYKIKINPTELDAQKLAKNMRWGDNFKCKWCGGDLCMTMRLTEVKDKKFEARVFCSQCGKA